MLSGIKRFWRQAFNRPRGVEMGPGSYLRRPFKVTYPNKVNIGANTVILSHALIQPQVRQDGVLANRLISIGDNVYIGRHVFIAASTGVVIADGCVLSDFVNLNDTSHGFNPDGGPIMQQPLESKGPVHIGRNCFLGYRSVIMPGVTLGEWCIVGANAVVTRSFPGFCILGGVPARVLKIYDHKKKAWGSVGAA